MRLAWLAKDLISEKQPKEKETLKDLKNIMKHCNTDIIGIPEKEKIEVYEKVVDKNFP